MNFIFSLSVLCCVFVLYIFVLCLVHTVTYVSELSVLDYPFGFLLIFI